MYCLRYMRKGKDRSKTGAFNVLLTVHRSTVNLPKPDPLYTGNQVKRKINFGTELFPM
jgi:hypothetical protein